jgi:hypothetical protein
MLTIRYDVRNDSFTVNSDKVGFITADKEKALAYLKEGEVEERTDTMMTTLWYVNHQIEKDIEEQLQFSGTR